MIGHDNGQYSIAAYTHLSGMVGRKSVLGQCAGDERRPHWFNKLHPARPRHMLLASAKLYPQSEIHPTFGRKLTQRRIWLYLIG